MSFADVQLRIQAACQRSGRSASEVRLVAVSKKQAPDKIETLFRKEGHLDFGENYVQELQEKQTQIPDTVIRWHLIGHLQKNKAKFVVGHCHLIHSVDSVELAQVISKKATERKIVQDVLLQVNLSDENSKEGLSAEELRTRWQEFQKLPTIRICGLMTMPPLQNEAAANRPYFEGLRTLLSELRSQTDLDLHPLNELSMGTSHDFEVAIEQGATLIRVGTLVFGERPGRDTDSQDPGLSN